MVPQGPTGLEDGHHLVQLAELGGMQVCLCRLAVAICDNTGRKSVEVGCKHPAIILMVSLKVTSTLVTCVLWPQTGEAYSAVL